MGKMQELEIEVFGLFISYIFKYWIKFDYNLYLQIDYFYVFIFNLILIWY